jgi:hypothetical protein
MQFSSYVHHTRKDAAHTCATLAIATQTVWISSASHLQNPHHQPFLKWKVKFQTLTHLNIVNVQEETIVDVQEETIVDVQEETSEGFVTMQSLSCEDETKSKLVCPLCRGHIKEWKVVEGARHFMNEKSRSCSCESCNFTGTYTDLRKHARVEHPLEQNVSVTGGGWSGKGILVTFLAHFRIPLGKIGLMMALGSLP